jgi:hypothetical protein
MHASPVGRPKGPTKIVAIAELERLKGLSCPPSLRGDKFRQLSDAGRQGIRTLRLLRKLGSAACPACFHAGSQIASGSLG